MLNLFLYSAIDPRNQYDYRFEQLADKGLTAFRHCFGGNRIILFLAKDPVILFKHPETDYPYESTKHKVASYILGFVFFIPCLALKTGVWIYHFRQIRERNNNILNSLKEMKQRDELMASMPNLSVKVGLSSPVTATSSFYLRLPDVLQLHSLSFLSARDVAVASRTNRTIYQLSQSGTLARLKELRELSYFPDFFVDLVKKENIKDMRDLHQVFSQPNVPLQRRMIYTYALGFKPLYLFNEKNKLTFTSKTHPLFLVSYRTMKSAFLGFLSNLREKGQPIRKWRFPYQMSAVITIQNNTPAANRKITSIYCDRVGQRWTISMDQDYETMETFLNEVFNESHKPRVMEYLTRLVNRQPCGVFPIALNPPNTSFDALQEGPTTTPDGKPVLELSE